MQLDIRIYEIYIETFDLFSVFIPQLNKKTFLLFLQYICNLTECITFDSRVLLI